MTIHTAYKCWNVIQIMIEDYIIDNTKLTSQQNIDSIFCINTDRIADRTISNSYKRS
jgi:hypothetical protein